MATSAEALPQTLGRYELLGVLGRGGMANVYLGRHAGGAGFQRLFAIKVLHPHLAQEEAFIEMLLDEARIAARLHHPNVVPIVDLGEQDGIYYVVMEYVEGCTLSVLLKKNRDRRPPRLLIPIILDALSGLHAAHSLTDDDGSSMRLVHRDVSPQNILVGVDGMARLTDFGIAKAESRINSTRPGELKGKISFMSPEQIRNPESVDHRSDVFSAGVLLWTALTGKHLFEAESTGAAMNNTLGMAIEPPSRVGLRPPAVFDTICLRALERSVAARLDSALSFEESLRAAATANGLCGSRREVGEWVLSAVGEELTERRNANKSSGNQRVARRIPSPAGGIGAVSDSRLKVAAAVNDAAPSIEPISIVSSSHSAARASAPVIESAPISARELGTADRRRNQWLLAGGAVLLVGGLVWGATLLSGPSSAPALAASAPKPGQASVATTPSAPAAAPEQAKPTAADDATTVQRVSASVSAEPSRAELSRRQAPQRAVRRSASALQPVAIATPTPKPESASAGEARVKKPAWDEDSPLPHP
jgi:serine/threonine protein kinase